MFGFVCVRIVCKLKTLLANLKFYIISFVKSESFLTFYKTETNVIVQFSQLWFINTLTMEPNFLDEGCDVFMNENQIIMEGGIQGDRFEEIPSSQFKNDNTMQLIMKKLYEQKVK